MQDDLRNLPVFQTPKNYDITLSLDMAFARCRFSIEEQRIMTFLYAQMQNLFKGHKLKEFVNGTTKVEPGLWGDIRFTISLSDLDFNDNRNYERIKKALRSLSQKTIEYQNKKAGITWGLFHIIESPKILDNKRVQLRIENELVEIFQMMHNGWRQINFETSINLSTVYAMRLYAIVSKQDSFKKLSRFKIEIDEFKKMLGIENKFSSNYDLERYIVKPIQKELDKKSPWSFNYKFLTTQGSKSKKFTHILFSPRHVAKNETTSSLEEKEEVQMKQNAQVAPKFTQVKELLMDKLGLPEQSITRTKNATTVAEFCFSCSKKGVDAYEQCYNYYEAALEKIKVRKMTREEAIPYVLACLKNFSKKENQESQSTPKGYWQDGTPMTEDELECLF